MVHFSSFEAVHYRGIDGLSLSPMTRINLITGSNGIGKTALLEAIWLFGKRYSPESVWHSRGCAVSYGTWLRKSPDP